MKRFRIVFSLISSCLFFTTVQAQTADEIIQKNLDASGGMAVLDKLNTLSAEGVASVMGMDLPTTLTIANGKGIKSITTYNGMDIINCITDTSGWMVNPVGGAPDPVGLPSDAIRLGKTGLDLRGEFYHFKEKGYVDSLLGREDYQGVSAYKIKLSQPDLDIVYLVDPNTYYILKMDETLKTGGAVQTNSVTFSNYKKTDLGFVMAYTKGVNQMGYDVSITFTKVEFNKDIDAKAFAVPK